jgi:hypothetical protein
VPSGNVAVAVQVTESAVLKDGRVTLGPLFFVMVQVGVRVPPDLTNLKVTVPLVTYTVWDEEVKAVVPMYHVPARLPYTSNEPVPESYAFPA